ncbi:hypothetical protein [Clostridium massiliodielmoense]|uniref:hypothetical protein n=1 Tax=Clostridium massiliodielmoense TaxID=1776385 RepID=UPI000B134B19|nr:hypothetical protein [Clostridium massiliodielmoense]
MKNSKNEKSRVISEKIEREYNKVNMKETKDLQMTDADKKRRNGKGSYINQFR